MRRIGPLLVLGMLGLCGSAQASSSRGESGKAHKVQPGQTLGMIAKRYNLSVEELCKANGITRKSPIKPEQVLVIPPKGAAIEPKTADEPWETAPAESAQANSGARSASSSARSRTREPLLRRASSSIETRDPYARPPARRGFVNITSVTGGFKGQALTRNGKVTDAARQAFVRVLSSWRTGQKEAIHDQLIRMLVKVSDHFGGRPMRIVSGFRPYSPTQYTPHSRHNLGHAADFTIPGVPNTVLRDYCMGLGSVGVGYYPNSTFVHLDVREAFTYWVDYSGPGERPRYANARNDIGSGATQSAIDKRPVGDYPAPRAIDPASFEQGDDRLHSESFGTHGSVRTQREREQVRDLL